MTIFYTLMVNGENFMDHNDLLVIEKQIKKILQHNPDADCQITLVHSLMNPDRWPHCQGDETRE